MLSPQFDISLIDNSKNVFIFDDEFIISKKGIEFPYVSKEIFNIGNFRHIKLTEGNHVTHSIFFSESDHIVLSSYRQSETLVKFLNHLIPAEKTFKVLQHKTKKTQTEYDEIKLHTTFYLEEDFRLIYPLKSSEIFKFNKEDNAGIQYKVNSKQQTIADAFFNRKWSKVEHIELKTTGEYDTHEMLIKTRKIQKTNKIKHRLTLTAFVLLFLAVVIYGATGPHISCDDYSEHSLRDAYVRAYLQKRAVEVYGPDKAILAELDTEVKDSITMVSKSMQFYNYKMIEELNKGSVTKCKCSVNYKMNEKQSSFNYIINYVDKTNESPEITLHVAL